VGWRDPGGGRTSGQTTLADDLALPAADRSVAFELFVPVYRDRASLLTTAERRAALLGWAAGAFRASEPVWSGAGSWATATMARATLGVVSPWGCGVTGPGQRDRLAGAERPKISPATVRACRSSLIASALASASPLDVSRMTLTSASFSCSPPE
jgi:hypothetical protein